MTLNDILGNVTGLAESVSSKVSTVKNSATSALVRAGTSLSKIVSTDSKKNTVFPVADASVKTATSSLNQKTEVVVKAATDNKGAIAIIAAIVVILFFILRKK